MALSTPTYERLDWKVWVTGGLMVLIGAVTAVLIARDFSSESYLYLVFYAIPANTAISVFPHEPVLIYFGKLGSIVLAASAAAVGTLVAAVMDHTVFVPILNHEGLKKYKEKKLYRKAIEYFMRWPFATIVVTGFTPIPFWPFKILSFSIHYPLWKYLLAVGIARFPRYCLLAWLGSVLDIPNWLLIGLFLAVIALYIVNAAPGAIRRLRKS